MMGILEDNDLFLIEEILNFWWEQHEIEFSSAEIEMIHSLWSYLKDFTITQNSLNPDDSLIFTQVWGQEHKSLEDWFLDIFDKDLSEEPDHIIKVLGYIWENNYPMKVIH